MFNLIVSGSGWQPHRDSFGSGRVLEYSDTAVAQRFMPNKVLDRGGVNSVAAADMKAFSLKFHAL